MTQFVKIYLVQNISIVIRIRFWIQSMASSRRYVISTAMFIQILMLSAVASPIDSVNPLGDFTKMNDDLLEELGNNDNSKIIPVIFQLNSPMTLDDENRISELDWI